MKTALLTSILLATLLSPTALADEDTQPGVKASEAWLAIVDKGQYKKSWTDASTYFKKSLKAGAWEAQLKAARGPLGPVVSRKLKVAQYATSLPGAPDGQYVVAQFSTSFEKKKEAVETVTSMKEGSVWRAAGYFIR